MNELFQTMIWPRSSIMNKLLARHGRAVDKTIRHSTHLHTAPCTSALWMERFFVFFFYFSRKFDWFRSSFSMEINLRCMPWIVMMIEMNGNNRKWEFWHFVQSPADNTYLFIWGNQKFTASNYSSSNSSTKGNEWTNENSNSETWNIEMKRTEKITSKLCFCRYDSRCVVIGWASKRKRARLDSLWCA